MVNDFGAWVHSLGLARLVLEYKAWHEVGFGPGELAFGLELKLSVRNEVLLRACICAVGLVID